MKPLKPLKKKLRRPLRPLAITPGKAVPLGRLGC
jgi:hypothetical protein